jgi:hypothetical protein
MRLWPPAGFGELLETNNPIGIYKKESNNTAVEGGQEEWSNLPPVTKSMG